MSATRRTITVQESANGWETRITDPFLGMIFHRLITRTKSTNGTTSPACLAACRAIHETYNGELGASCDASLDLPDAPFAVCPSWNHECGKVGECARFEGIEFSQLGRMLGPVLA